MDLPGKFSLEEMLTAFETRLPRGRLVSSVVIAVFAILVVLFGISKIVEILSPVFGFLRTRQWPSVSGDDIASVLVAVVIIAIPIALAALAFSRFRGQTRVLDSLVKRSAISLLIQAKETATNDLLNATFPNAPGGEPKAHWIGRIKAWEKRVDELLRQAGATEGELSAFRTLVSFNPLYPALDEEHARQKGMLAERIHRLSDIIRDLEKRNPSR